MKKLLFGFITLFTFNAYSQTPELKSAKLAIGFTFSPDYCYRSLSSDPDVDWVGDSRNDMEVPKLGYTTGVRILYTLGDRVALESGLLFSDKGEKTKKIQYTNGPHWAGGFFPESGVHNHHYYYLDIPVKVNYYFGFKKVNFFVSGGTSINFFLAEKRASTYTMADGSTEKRKSTSNIGFHQVNLAAEAGMGVDYALTEKLTIRVEPIYRRSLVSIINTPVKSNLYSFGTNFGLFLSL